MNRASRALLLIAALAGGLLLSTMRPLVAQQAPEPPAQKGPEKQYTLILTETEANQILAVLTEAPMPWKVSNALLKVIVKQTQEQNEKAAAEPKK